MKRRSSQVSAPGLSGLLQKFFCEYLQAQRRVSPATVASYRDTFRLLLQFVEQQTGRKPVQQQWSDWTAPVVLRFLEHLEKKRGNTTRSRNVRLAAIRSFMRYAGQEPTALALATRILAIPMKRFNCPLIGFLSEQEVESLLAALSPATFLQRRDRTLFQLLYQSGARISEALALNRADIQWGRCSYLQLRGKGRKQRLIPLSKSFAQILHQWLKELPTAADTPLFPACSGQRLTRFGAEKRLRLAVQKAARSCSTLRNRKITLHMLRHSTAMRLLQSGVDIMVIALWLGHERPNTTHQYVELDLEMKQKCLRHLSGSVNLRTRNIYKPNDRLMAFLDNL